MTLDGMRWSVSKVQAIRASMLPEEHFIDYVFPLLRYHSRVTELTANDWKYYFKDKTRTTAGYYMRAVSYTHLVMKTLGIIGGLGPMATAYFMELVTGMTDVDCDQKHIPIVLQSIPQTPDRTSYILDHIQDVYKRQLLNNLKNFMEV